MGSNLRGAYLTLTGGVGPRPELSGEWEIAEYDKGNSVSRGPVTGPVGASTTGPVVPSGLEVVFPDFYAGLTLYLENLPPQRRVVLGRELRQFVEENEGTSVEELTRRWLRLGAQGWQASLDIHRTLEEFCRTLNDEL